jgi:hypothetical protein
MPLPFPPNVSISIYRTGNAPPNPADVTAKGYLTSNYFRHTESGEGDAANTRYTATLLVDLGVDIRDDYQFSAQMGNNYDTVYIGSTSYKVVFVEIKGAGTSNSHKKAYLDRAGVDWPATSF